jgi:integrase
MNTRATQMRSGIHDQSMINAHLDPFFGHFTLEEIKTEQLDQFVGIKRDLSRKTVHNILTLLISMLNLAKELGWIEKVPLVKKPRVRTFNSEFRYLRSNDEVKKFLISAQTEGIEVYTLYATAVYTGLRAGEIAGLQWADIDFSKRLITVQRSFLGPTKKRRCSLRTNSRSIITNTKRMATSSATFSGICK